MYCPDEECRAMIAALKNICKLKNVSPFILAKECGISTSTMSYLLNGKTNPQISTILILCNALGISAGDLFENRKRFDDTDGSEMVEQYVTQEEMELLYRYRLFSEKKKVLLNTYVDMLSQYQELTDGKKLNK